MKPLCDRIAKLEQRMAADTPPPSVSVAIGRFGETSAEIATRYLAEHGRPAGITVEVVDARRLT